MRSFRGWLFGVVTVLANAAMVCGPQGYARGQDQGPAVSDKVVALAQSSVCQSTTTVKTTTARLTRDAVQPAAQAPAAPAPASGVTVTSTALGLTSFVDGHGQMTTGVAIPIYTVLGTAGKLKVVSITGVGVTNGTAGDVFTGFGLRYDVWSSSAGFKLSLIAGWKGPEFNNGLQIPHGVGNGILGVSFSVPIGSP